ncbi:MAG: MoxR family ATPase [Actinobacteria bacterium]|nr:MoxR family ATPase [Actinomycetota bacterium]
MRKPLLLEGEAGVGKTAIAKAVARILEIELIRLQCYEGIDASQALFEWDYPRQLLFTRGRIDQSEGGLPSAHDIYTEDFLLERPLLKALRTVPPPVLLIDEIDRADAEFEAFLLELLSDFSISIPEVGTIAAAVPPIVVLTSNRTRELHDALKRRCFYQWIDFPTPEREVEIIALRAPEVERQLAESVARLMARLRGIDLQKPPGAAEAIDWATALHLLGAGVVDEEMILRTLGSVVKNWDDQRLVEGMVGELVA